MSPELIVVLLTALFNSTCSLGALMGGGYVLYRSLSKRIADKNETAEAKFWKSRLEFETHQLGAALADAKTEKEHVQQDLNRLWERVLSRITE